MRRYLANRREAREARKMEAEMAAHEARERSAADEEERVRALLSGARGGCYPMTVAVEQSHGRVLSEMTRNTRRLDLDAMGVEPGETIVASRAEGAFGSLAPPDERDRYSREPRVYFVAAGRVDVLAPGPDPDDPEPGRKRWHLAHAVVPGGWFSGPMGELHGEAHAVPPPPRRHFLPLGGRKEKTWDRRRVVVVGGARGPSSQHTLTPRVFGKRMSVYCDDPPRRREPPRQTRFFSPAPDRR